MNTVPDDILREAVDPQISAERLFEIAGQYPDAHPFVASNPQAYEALLDWLRQVGSPLTQAVVAQRDAGLSGAEAYDAACASLGAPAPASDGGETQVMATTEEPQAEETDSPAAPEDAATESLASEPEPVNADDIQATQAIAPVSVPDPTPAQGFEQPPAIAPAGQGPQQGYGYVPQNQQGYVPQQPYAAPAYAQQPYAQPQAKKPMGLILLAILLALVLIGLIATYFLVFAKDGSSPEAAPTVSSSQSGREGPSTPATSETPEETTETPSEQAPRYPAPAGAAQSRNFHMPSNNINCQIDDDNTRCTIFEQDFTSCGGDPVTVTLSEDGVSQTCSTGRAVESGSGGVLVYDTSTTYSDFACTSTPSGVKCWDTRSGRGFTLARQGAATTQE
ncbi:hypothetical protein H8R18_08575 [Nanchangia anserum]|uniref:Leucine rich repeat variant domain-containing protein n=1 Tax=Nanchangia anserum TaxID=2692125 RepID=A0A8I0GDJ1_9ACTO|nr:hypothetical protein [Nanchangia anserum]MBD3689568.1 hypothetical protein [Nanchangia anserum]QOX81753.1 hypothetical protein H8R18_08575 [Nanchangia anserum]